MSKREKIIVGFMVAAILYGGYNFLFSGSAGGKKRIPGKPQVAVSEFVTDLIKRIRSADTTAADTEILEKSSARWQKDPFQVITKAEDPGVENEKKPDIIADENLSRDFLYSGYMEMGKRKLAIINGMEYQEGDRIDSSGAALKKILPGEVRIYVDAKKSVIVVPIDDMTKQ